MFHVEQTRKAPRVYTLGADTWHALCVRRQNVNLTARVRQYPFRVLARRGGDGIGGEGLHV